MWDVGWIRERGKRERVSMFDELRRMERVEDEGMNAA